jgi:hypothetical protein
MSDVRPPITKKEADVTKHQSDVTTTREKIRLAEQKVESQRRLVTDLKSQGYGVWLAKEMLAAAEDTLRAHQAHLAALGAR